MHNVNWKWALARSWISFQIIGCQPKNSKVLADSVKAGHIVFDEENLDTLSDGTAGNVEKDSVTLSPCIQCVDDWEIVTEEQIEQAVFFMLQHHHKVSGLSHYTYTLEE